jgi:hypothetical protein
MTEAESRWAAVLGVALLIAPIVVYIVGRVRKK